MLILILKNNRFIELLLKKKKIIIISNDKISTEYRTIFSSIVNLCFVIWFFYASFFYFKNMEVIDSKNNSIRELNSANLELKNNIRNFVGLFDNIKSYLYSLNSYDRFEGFETANFDRGLSIINDDFLDNKSYNDIVPILARIDKEANNINNLIGSRVTNVENLITKTGIDKNKVKNVYTVNYLNNEQKYSSDEYLISKNSVVKKTNFDDINKKIDYLNYLESFVNSMPLTNPMDTYRVTSRFGDRPDPFEKNTRFHRGLDIAGPLNSKVKATASGIITYAGEKRGYGNYVKIRHNNSITTEYAHLKSIAVKVGDTVKRGDLLGLQGNTGRSTGTHLHYEIRVDNEVKDPHDFIKVGDRIF